MPSLNGFIGGTFQNLSLPADAQTTINLFPERLESGNGRSPAILIAAPGKASYVDWTDGPIRGLFAQDGRCFGIGGAIVAEVLSGGVLTHATGGILLSDAPVWFASNGTGGNQLFFTAGGRAYIWSLLTNVVTVAPFPGANASCACFVDGYFLALSADGKMYASALEDGTSWNALSVGQNNITSDQTVALIVDDHRTLWTMGTKTSVPWTNVAATPFAFQPVPGAVMNKGVFGPGAVARYDNTLVFGGTDETGIRSAFVVAGGYAATRISNTGLENIWRGYTRVDDLVVWTYSENGHAFAVFYFPSANATWVYDGSTQMWHQRGLWNTLTGQFDADRGRCHCFFDGQHLVGSRNSSLVYRQSLDLYDDAGSPKRWLRRSPHLFNGDNRWNFGYKFELLMETGVGLITGQGSDPQVMLRWSDDMGRTFGNDRQASFGRQGEYRIRMQWYRLGRFRDRIWEVSGSDPVKTVLIDALFFGQAEQD